MPGITLDPVDAAELAKTFAFLADWLSGSQKQALADSFAAFVGHPPTTPAPSAPTCTGSSSSSAPATAKNSSASRHNDQHDQANAPRSWQDHPYNAE
jgi:hypothetical protein